MIQQQARATQRPLHLLLFDEASNGPARDRANARAVKHEDHTARKRLLCGPAGTRPGDLLPVSETTFTAYLHSALKIQDQMLVVNDSCNMSWSDRNRISSKYSARTLLEHLTLARGNESIPEPTPRDPG